MKHDFAFVEFSDPRDADDAKYNLDSREVDGSRIIVEFAKGGPRGSREYMGRGPPPGSGRCFNCGIDGHWARDCKAGDWKNKCYRCGERGHIERNCKNSPNKPSGRSYSSSPVRSRSPHRGRSCDRSYSRDRSHSRSRSPVRRERSPVYEDRSESPRYRSPERKSSPPSSKRRNDSPALDEGSPQKRGDVSPRNENGRQDGSDYSDGPRRKRSKSPVSPKSNGGHSASPRDDRSPIDDDEETRHSPRGRGRGSESP